MKTAVRTSRLENIEIGFKIVKYDDVKQECNLEVYLRDISDSDDDGKSKLMKNVEVTGLLNYKLKNQVDDYSLKKDYRSMIYSGDWRENPFQLIRYDKDGVETLLLACVNEAPKIRKEVVDPLGGVHLETRFTYYKRSDYKRYRDCVKRSV